MDKDGEKLELLPVWAENMTTVLGRFGGRTVGVIANNPAHIGGVLDSAAGEKAARFVRTCDAFGIPLIVIADVTGFLAWCRSRVGRRGAPWCEVAARFR